MTEKLITRELLIEWNACAQGMQRFCELFPDGADLKTAIEVLVNDGHNDWGVWLFKKCREHKLYVDFVVKGYRNSGDYNSGDYNSGYGNSGNRNSGNRNSGNRNSGNYNSGNRNSGNYNSGDYNSGYRNSGNYNSGYRNSGNYNSGYRNSGDGNSGDYNSGDGNSGYGNSGNRNSGDGNSGDYNSGYGNSGNRNSGNYNSGDCNSGNYNSGDYNSGYFNSETPEDILVFNKPVSRDVWNNTKKPQFISNVKLCFWVDASEMTDAEKIADPDFYVRGGCLRNRDYKEVWKIAWDNRQQDDERILRQLPNFDAKVFEKITGIKLGE